ncbi:MAG: hypothetical protein OEY29_15160 [Gammaproteobacteria bacterium]|nr:hypothetical protein [Gammaproteobacteria bacterium]
MQAKINQYNQLFARGAVLLTAAVVFFVFYQSYESKKTAYDSLSSQLSTQVQRFKTLGDTTLLASEYENRFNEFMPVNQYATEDRIYWLDALQSMRLKHKIPALNYTFSQRKAYDYKDGLIKDKGLKVSVTDIKLSMKLMHEADLVSVLKDIKKIKSSIHVVSSCDLKRLTKAGAAKTAASVANIDAVCHVKWFTFKVI